MPRDESATSPRRALALVDDLKISEVLAAFRADLPPERVALADVVAVLGRRSLGSFLLILAFPTILPVPLGLSVLFNLPVLVFAIQMVIGRGLVVLPGWLLRRSLDTEVAGRLIDRLLPVLRRGERLSRPRWPALILPGLERWLGLACLGMAAIAIIPLPLVGWLPGFGLVLVGLGLMERDGLAVASGLVFGIAALVFFLFVILGLLYAGNTLFN